MPTQTQDAFFEQLVSQDDISWKAMILESVRTNQMDPWDINISFIASQFLTLLKQYQEMNFKVSGKIILASALMLKLKSRRFLTDDISILDQLIASTNQIDEQPELLEGEDDDQYQEFVQNTVSQTIAITPKTPQTRKRKVSVYDLIEALEKALELEKKRSTRNRPIDAPKITVPQKSFDITQSIESVKRQLFAHPKSFVSFSELLPTQERQDKLLTFIPLLHLRNLAVVDLHQKEHFSDFDVETLVRE
ncbi:MAG: segregation/condensation protein A [Candidatus Woesearchaeota archaeon]